MFLIPADESFVGEIVNISRVCKLNLWTENDYILEINRRDSFNSVAFEKRKSIGFLFARLIKSNVSDDLFTGRRNEQISETAEEKTKEEKTKEEKTNRGKNSGEFSEAEILNIAVDPDRQNTGVGQIILKSFLDFCIENGIKTIWLEVRESNLGAQRFYLKNGFQIAHTRKNYYREPSENALIMKLDLNLS